MQPLALGAEALAFGCPKKMGQKKRKYKMSYLNSVTLVGFVGADPEQRQAKGNGSKVEWHRISIFRPRLAEYVLTAIKKGAHVLIEGSLVSSTYEQPNGKGKKSKAAKITSWSIRADVVRKLDRNEPEPEAPATTQ